MPDLNRPSSKRNKPEMAKGSRKKSKSNPHNSNSKRKRSAY